MKTARFDRSSRVFLALVALLLLADIGQLAYRLSQPTDGWMIRIDPGTHTFSENLLGQDSPIQPNDKLVSVAGADYAEMSLRADFPDIRPSNWQVGQSVTYRVVRAGQDVALQVPLYRWTAGPILKTFLTPFPLVGLVAVSLGMLAFLKRPREWGTRALLLFGASLFCSSVSGIVNQAVDAVVPTRLLSSFFSFALFGLVMFPSFFLLAVSFPQPKQFVRRRPWLVLGAVYGATPLLMLIAGNAGVGWLTVIGFALLSVVAVVHSTLTARDAVSRAQMRWAVSGVAVGAIAMVLSNTAALYFVDRQPDLDVSPALAQLPLSLAFLSFSLGFSVAILRYRLWDIDILIRRTLIYSVLTALLALVYFGATDWLQSVFHVLTGQEQSEIVVVLSTLAIAALVLPLRARIQRGIDRCFYRRKYEAATVLAAFGVAARDEVDLHQLSEHLLGAVDETLQPEHASLWLRKG